MSSDRISWTAFRGASLGLLAGLTCVGAHAQDAQATASSSYANLEAAKAWQELVETLRYAGDYVIRDAETDRDVIDGLQYLIEPTLRYATDAQMIGPPDKTPVLHDFTRNYSPQGCPNPDQQYYTLLMEPGRTYKVQGKLNNAVQVAFNVYGLVPPDKRTSAGGSWGTSIDGAVTTDELRVEKDGSFELVLGPARPKGAANFLRVTPGGPRTMYIREIRYDLLREQRSTFSVELMNEPIPSDAGTEKRVAASDPVFTPLRTTDAKFGSDDRSRAEVIRRVALTIRAVVEAGRPFEAEGLRHAPNTFKFVDLAQFNQNATLQYGLIWADLKPGQALVVEGPVPDTRYWQTNFCDRYAGSPGGWTSGFLNTSKIEQSPDGHYRLVYAPADPKMPNWVDLAGHQQGWIMFRYLKDGKKALPTPKVSVINLDATHADAGTSGLQRAQAARSMRGDERR